MVVFYIFIFILGTVIGSFLNVIIARLKTKESISKTRSHCPFCKKKLSWQELIPIFSFLIQRGKCRNCKKKISWQYPLVELTTGLLFVAGLNYESGIMNFDFLFLLVIFCFLTVLFVFDLKYYLIPDKVIYPAIIITFLYKVFYSLFIIHDSLFIVDYLIAAIIGGAFFLIIVLISRGRWMGMGDVKIGFLMGLLLGWELFLVALFLAFFSGALISIILLILRKKKLKSEIPFGPFLTAATFITLLWGDSLINWYFNLFI